MLRVCSSFSVGAERFSCPSSTSITQVPHMPSSHPYAIGHPASLVTSFRSAPFSTSSLSPLLENVTVAIIFDVKLLDWIIVDWRWLSSLFCW